MDLTLARLHRVSASFLAAISDPEHADHEDLLEWVGGRFDPTAFDLEAVNRALQPVQRRRDPAIALTR